MTCIKICTKCSCIDKNFINKCADKAGCEIKTGCVKKCRKKCPELHGKLFGVVDNKLIVAEKKKAFIKALKDNA